MQGEGDQQQHNNNQDRNVNKQQPQQQGQQQHNEPQKCPRCESLNTKFCYYNNYSLSQPRYFCKACKRYWTKGGTLRNVPVGGGCRKGSKRAKTMSSSSSATSSRTVLQPQQQQDHQLHERSLMMSTGPAAMNLGQCYSGGTGYLTSSSFNENLGHLGGSGQLGSSGRGVSDLGLLHGFNANSSFGQRQLQTQPFNSMEPPPLYPLSQDHRGLVLQPAMSGGSVIDWSKSFINKSHASASAAAASTGHNTLWSTTMGNNTSSPSGAGPSLNSSQDDHAASYAADLPP